MERGQIVFNSPSNLVWKLETYTFLNGSFSFDSSNFVYNGHNWHLQLLVQNDELHNFHQLRLICKRSADDSESFTQTYSLSIEINDKGVSYWTSDARTDKFGPDGCGNFHNLPFLENKRMKWKIRLRFETTKEQQPAAAVDLEEANSHSRLSTDAGTQTCSDAVVNLEEGKWRSRTATDAGTQTCSDGTDQLLQNFKDLLLNGHKTDVTFKIDGTEFKAHKAILSARSPVFEKMFDHDMLEEISGCVEIADCDPEDFHAFLLYLYTGKMEKPTVKSAVGLYCLADKYNVEGLAPYCVQFLLSNLSVESYCTIVSLGLRHCDTELLTSAKAFFASNLKQIVGTEQWKSFITENLAEANEILIQGLSEVNLVPK